MTVDQLASRLRERAILNEATGCLEWSGPTVGSGYGRINFRGQNYRAHRAAWVAHHGEIPQGMVVCHRCDNRLCVNVDHLFLGTLRDNALDMCQKGRHSNGRSERTHCPQGHPYDEANTYTSPQGKRYCRACIAVRTKRWYENKKQRGAL